MLVIAVNLSCFFKVSQKVVDIQLDLYLFARMCGIAISDSMLWAARDCPLLAWQGIY